MKINGILNNNYTPTFRGTVVAYPEYQEAYNISKTNANKADTLTSDPLSALVNKFAKAYRLLFTPEITASANNIKEGIDILFDDKQVGKTLNKIA